MAADIKQSIGLRVRVARQRGKLTQEELGARIGRTPESVSNIERGLQLPSVETLVELGHALGIPASEFLEGIERTEAPRTAKRIEMEVRLREIARALSDHGLAVAVAQADILLRERL